MLDPDIKDSVLEHTKSVLKNNWQGSYTIPAKGLYPHQWLWDSCFIAIGYANYDLDKAQTEVRSLLRGQWSNGMLSHMIFADDDKHSRDRRIWQSWKNPHSPDDLNTKFRICCYSDIS